MGHGCRMPWWGHGCRMHGCRTQVSHRCRMQGWAMVYDAGVYHGCRMQGRVTGVGCRGEDVKQFCFCQFEVCLIDIASNCLQMLSILNNIFYF